jgi:hypothetical protein
MNALATFEQFFAACVGSWKTERTYHYLTHQEVERSHTDFAIKPLAVAQKQQVLVDNAYELTDEALALEALMGFHLAFQTVSETGEQVGHALNMLFVPKSHRRY